MEYNLFNRDEYDDFEDGNSYFDSEEYWEYVRKSDQEYVEQYEKERKENTNQDSGDVE